MITALVRKSNNEAKDSNGRAVAFANPAYSNDAGAVSNSVYEAIDPINSSFGVAHADKGFFGVSHSENYSDVGEFAGFSSADAGEVPASAQVDVGGYADVFPAVAAAEYLDVAGSAFEHEVEID